MYCVVSCSTPNVTQHGLSCHPIYAQMNMVVSQRTPALSFSLLQICFLEIIQPNIQTLAVTAYQR